MRRRGPSAQLARAPLAACSSSSPKRSRMCSSRSRPSSEGGPPNQKVMRRFKASADSGSLPNQNSRTLRASSMGYSDPLRSASNSFSSCFAASRVVARNLVSSSLT
jgi:hypothetical protein